MYACAYLPNDYTNLIFFYFVTVFVTKLILYLDENLKKQLCIIEKRRYEIRQVS